MLRCKEKDILYVLKEILKQHKVINEAENIAGNLKYFPPNLR